MATQKILVTGGFGFIGSNFVRDLVALGHEVIVFDNASRGRRTNLKDLEDKIKVVQGDICDLNSLKIHCDGVDSMVHLAAVQGTGNFYSIPHKVLEVNVKGIINALEATIQCGIKRFFFSSSSEAYGVPKIFPTPETHELIVPDVLNPRYSYGGSKIIGELFTINYAKQYGFDYTMVRYHNVYGPAMGWEHVLPQFIKRLEKGEEFTIQGDGKQTRAFCYISDAVDCSIKALLSENGKNDIFNVGNPKEEWDINHVVKVLSKVSSKKINPKHIPFEGEGTKRRIPDITKAVKKLGYSPKVSFEDGLKKTYDWYSKEIRDTS